MEFFFLIEWHTAQVFYLSLGLRFQTVLFSCYSQLFCRTVLSKVRLFQTLHDSSVSLLLDLEYLAVGMTSFEFFMSDVGCSTLAINSAIDNIIVSEYSHLLSKP